MTVEEIIESMGNLLAAARKSSGGRLSEDEMVWVLYPTDLAQLSRSVGGILFRYAGPGLEVHGHTVHGHIHGIPAISSPGCETRRVFLFTREHLLHSMVQSLRL